MLAIVQDNVNVQTTLKELAQTLLPLIVVYKEGGVPVIDSLESDDAEAALSAKQGKILKALIEAGGGGGGGHETFITLTSDFDLGGIKKGAIFEHKTVAEMFNALLVEEYVPKWTNATAAITLPGGVNPVMCVGDRVPSSSSFGRSYSEAKAETTINGTPYTAKNTYQKYEALHSTTQFDSPVTTRREVIISGDSVFSKGTTTVKSSKGNDTDKTASDSQTPLAEATVNDKINNDFTITGMQVSAETKIQFAYPIYINGKAQPLDYDKNCYGEDKDMTFIVSTTQPLEIEIPKSYTNFHLYYWDNLEHDWDEVTVGKFEKSKVIGQTNISVNYNSYEFTEISGKRPYKFIFEIN